MEPFDVAQRFFETCHREPCPTEQLAVCFQDATAALGFRYFACCSHVDPLNPPPQAIMIHNYPAAWVQHFSSEKLYEIDPVLQRAQRDLKPFFWDDELRSHSITAAQQKILLDATEFGIAHGFTIPIHLSWLPGTLRASCSMVPQATDVQEPAYRMIELIATSMYAALSRARLPRREATAIALSPRERECLILAAQGKDDWAIGKLLGLSSTTVHSYIKRLMRRLGVGTRVQAIVWALAAGQIAFGDVPAQRGGPPR